MVTIQDLLERPFSVRNDSEKVDIVCAGKPRPQLQRTMFRDANTLNNIDIYARVSWLTACEKDQAYFCWPCLLFAADNDDWCSTGFTKYNKFIEAVAQHKKAKFHVQSLLHYQLFRYKHSLLEDSEIPSSNTEVKAAKDNRKPVLQALHTVLCVISQQCAISEHLVKRPRLEVSDCINTLQFLGTLEVESGVFEDSIQFLKSNPRVLTDTVPAVAKLLRDAVKAEAQMSSYVSLILNEHSKITHKSLISTVLRYLKNGKVQERFLGFFEINQYKTADVVYQFISRIIEEYELSEKFVAYSVDGAVLASSHHMKPLKFRLRDDYPFSYFAPCYFHDLNTLLEQRLSNLMEIKRLFNNLRAIKAFFSGNPKSCRILEGFLGANTTPGLERGEWCDTRFLCFTKTHRVQLIKFFESILINHAFWESMDLPKGIAFQQILQDFETVFVLETFYKILTHTSQLRETLMGPSSESAIDNNMVDSLKSALDKDRQFEAFESFWLSVVSEMLDGQTDTKNLSLQRAMESEKKMMYREFYLKIFDLLIEEIGDRFESLTDLLFFHIFDPEKHENCVVREVCDESEMEVVRSETPLDSLLLVHGPCFESHWVENELKVYFKNSLLFPSKSVYDLLDFFVSADLKKTFRNLNLIAELILAMPCKPPSGKPSGTSKLKSIDLWASVWESKEFFNDLALLCVEGKFLDELKDQPDFLEDIVLKYQECETLGENTMYVIDVQML